MFPCYAGSCSRVAVASMFCLLPVRNILAAETDRVVISPMATLGKLALALAIVLFVFWMFAKVLRQFQGFKGGSHQGLRVVSALSVGQRERVVVIQAGDEQLVLGVTSSQINTLHVMGRPLPPDDLGRQQGEFKKKLSDALKRQVPDA